MPTWHRREQERGDCDLREVERLRLVLLGMLCELLLPGRVPPEGQLAVISDCRCWQFTKAIHDEVTQDAAQM